MCTYRLAICSAGLSMLVDDEAVVGVVVGEVLLDDDDELLVSSAFCAEHTFNLNDEFIHLCFI